MDDRDIDRCIARYTEERRYAPKQIALQHLLGHFYLVGKADEVDPFFRRVRVLLLCYIEKLSLFDNPLRNAQACWLLFFPAGLVGSVYFAARQEFSLLGLVYCAATMIYGTSLLVMVIRKWIDIGIELVYCRELLDYIDSRQYAPA